MLGDYCKLISVGKTWNNTFLIRPCLTQHMSEKVKISAIIGRCQSDDKMASEINFWINGCQHTANIWGDNDSMEVRTAKILLVDDSVPDVEIMKLPLGQLDFKEIIVTQVDAESIKQFSSAIVRGVTDNPTMELAMSDYNWGCPKVCQLSSSLVNGGWLHPFYRGDTTVMPFFKNENESVEIKMMKQTNRFNWEHFEDLQASMLELPFADARWSMFFLLPDLRYGLQAVENRMSELNLTTILKGIDNPTMMEISVPCCYLQTTFCDQRGDTSQNDDTPKSLRHQDYISVRHTAVILGEGDDKRRSLRELSRQETFRNKIRFVVDQPFLFFIYERESNSILISGRAD